MTKRAAKQPELGVDSEGKKWNRFKTLRDVSKHYDVNYHTVQKMRAAGDIQPASDGRWDTRLLDPIFEKRQERGGGKKTFQVFLGDALDDEKKRVEINRIVVDTEIKKLKREHMRGQLLDADQARAGIAGACSVILSRLLALPGAWSFKLQGMGVAEMEEVMNRELRATLIDLSEELSRPIEALQRTAAEDEDEDAEEEAPPAP